MSIEIGRVVLHCDGKTKAGIDCRRYIVGYYDGGETGTFDHPTLGSCDMRNQVWVCYQHQEEHERLLARIREGAS